MGKVSRRAFLQSASAPAETAYAPEQDRAFREAVNHQLPAFQRTALTLAPYTGAWGEAQAVHLLRRTMFGVRKTEVDTIKAMTMSAAVDYMIDTAPNPLNPPVNNYTTTSASTVDTTPVAPNMSWVSAAKGNGTINFLRMQSLRYWWAAQMIRQNLCIHEKMVLFWHHLIPTSISGVSDARFSYKYNALLRQYATGNYKSLVRAVTTDPAMLLYLNGHYNTRTAPDENYGRELQELFTVGKFPSQPYSESDVQAAARVLTGWQADATNITSTFNAAKHHTGNKQFSAFYGNAVIAGQTTAAGGAAETDQLINMIFQRPEVAKYLCRRLYRFFVYYVIDDSVETNVIAPLAQILIDNNFEIKPVLRALFKSEHFWDTDSMGCYIKTPVDFVAGMMRQFDVVKFGNMFLNSTGTSLNANEEYKVWAEFVNQMNQIGFYVGDPPSVSGWPAFYQAPEYYESWINSATLLRRSAIVDRMLGGGFTYADSTFKIDPLAYAGQFATPENPDALLDQLCLHLLGMPVTAAKRASLKSILLSGQVSNGYWTSAWNAYKADTANKTNAGIVSSRLLALLKAMMYLAEYQVA